MNIKTRVGLLAAVALSLQSMFAQAPPPPDGQAVEAPTPGKPENAVSVPVNVSPGTAEVVKLAESGLGDEVVMAYVTNSQAGFNLSAEDIVYLKDVGISETVITLMMSRDKVLRDSGVPANVRSPAPPPMPEPQAPVVTPPATPPPAYVTNPPEDVNYFYSELAPYGTWIDLEGVGWCWQPRTVVINHDWRPYCDYGHWAYTDCGWYWSSSYSWGWAPFHYGRWQSHPRCGWVWTPDRTWGPAWVSWRVAGDSCGWAPLPPLAIFDVHGGWRYRGSRVGVEFDFGLRPEHFTFVAFRNFNERDIGHHRLAGTEVTRIYNHTTIVNNYTVSRNNIVNHGVSVDRVAAETHTPIRRMTVREVSPSSRSGTVGASRPSEGRNAVYRRELPSRPAPAQNIVAQRVDANHPVVQHTPITPLKVDNGRNPSRSGPLPREAVNNNNSSSETSRGTRLGSRDRSPTPNGTISSPAEPDRRGTRTVPSERNTPSRSDNSGSRNADRSPVVTPPSTPSHQAPTGRDVAPTSRSADRPTVVTPPSVPRNSPSRDYEPVQRPSRSEGRDYQPVPRSASRPDPSESRAVSPQYQPKGYQQSSEGRSAPRSEPRQSSPAPSRSSDDKGSSSGRNRDRDR
jgi:hypothetical protein